MTDDLHDLVADRGKIDIEALQSLGGNPLALVEKTEQDVLCADVVVVEEARLFLG